MKLFTIPNFLTLGNLFAGCLSILYITGFFGEDPKMISTAVMILMIISLVFDLLDGMVARLMKISSDIGVQLDSLADMVSFGVVPGFMMVQILGKTNIQSFSELELFGLLITFFSALRLAKFNVDTEQSSYFKGLATPANTLLIFSFYWLIQNNGIIFSEEFDNLFLLVITFVTSLLLIANLPLFSFKLKGFSWKDNDFIYIFLIICLILLILFKIASIPFIILTYIIISIIFRKKIIHA